jgi:iron complex transport system substrate-binding protein
MTPATNFTHTPRREILRIEDITRREFMFSALGAALLIACGDDDDAGAPEAAATRDFIDVSGKAVQVPDRARRIVVTHDSNAGSLLALGAPVVGLATRDGNVDPLKRYFDIDSIETVGEYFEPNVEAIAALHPDLIVHEGYAGEVTLPPDVMQQLQRIAPVVGIDVFRPVEEVMADVAELLGGDSEAEFERQKAEMESAIEELRTLLGERWPEVTASFVNENAGVLEAWAPRTLEPSEILSRVGVQWVPLMLEAEKPEHDGYIADISLERLPEFAADLILVNTGYGSAINQHPLFLALEAVREGQVIELDETFGGAHFPAMLVLTRYLSEQIGAMQPLRTDIV